MTELIMAKLLQPVKLINFIITLICLVGVVYQVYLIMNNYMLGKTVVNIEVKMMKGPLRVLEQFALHMLADLDYWC